MTSASPPRELYTTQMPADCIARGPGLRWVPGGCGTSGGRPPLNLPDLSNPPAEGVGLSDPPLSSLEEGDRSGRQCRSWVRAVTRGDPWLVRDNDHERT